MKFWSKYVSYLPKLWKGMLPLVDRCTLSLEWLKEQVQAGRVAAFCPGGGMRPPPLGDQTKSSATQPRFGRKRIVLDLYFIHITWCFPGFQPWNRQKRVCLDEKVKISTDSDILKVKVVNLSLHSGFLISRLNLKWLHTEVVFFNKKFLLYSTEPSRLRRLKYRPFCQGQQA